MNSFWHPNHFVGDVLFVQSSNPMLGLQNVGLEVYNKQGCCTQNRVQNSHEGQWDLWYPQGNREQANNVHIIALLPKESSICWKICSKDCGPQGCRRYRYCLQRFRLCGFGLGINLPSSLRQPPPLQLHRSYPHSHHQPRPGRSKLQF